MEAIKLLNVYLDSSDYSVLSDPSRNSEDISFLREKFTSLADSGVVRFWYSAAHIVEMSPLEPRHNKHAELRTDLLVSLCGKNALISIDRIIEGEIEALRSQGKHRFNPYSDEGDWFPEIDDSFFTISKSFREEVFEEVMRERPIGRKLRRQLTRATIKNGRFSQAAKQTLAEGEAEHLKDILDRYPMREEDALIFSRYIRGEETKELAKEAFRASLRDPRWMMHWYRENSEKMSHIIQWLRGPANSFLSSLQRLSEEMRSLRERDDLTNQMEDFERDKLLVFMLSSLCKRLSPSGLDANVRYSKDDFMLYTPGLYAMLATSIDVILASAAKNSRIPKASDFADLVHSMYVPYVDIFRTDGFMSPLVKSNNKHLNTLVVGKLKDTIAAIELVRK